MDNHERYAVIIVGLPGSGKTTLINSNTRLFDKIFDDYLDYMFTGCIEKYIKEHRNIDITVCFSDPRLCKPSHYDDLIAYLSSENISPITIIFENNPNQCAINKPRYTPMINHYTRFYQPDYYTSNDSIIVPVYNPN